MTFPEFSVCYAVQDGSNFSSSPSAIISLESIIRRKKAFIETFDNSLSIVRLNLLPKSPQALMRLFQPTLSVQVPSAMAH